MDRIYHFELKRKIPIKRDKKEEESPKLPGTHYYCPKCEDIFYGTTGNETPCRFGCTTDEGDEKMKTLVKAITDEEMKDIMTAKLNRED